LSFASNSDAVKPGTIQATKSAATIEKERGKSLYPELGRVFQFISKGRQATLI